MLNLPILACVGFLGLVIVTATPTRAEASEESSLAAEVGALGSLALDSDTISYDPGVGLYGGLTLDLGLRFPMNADLVAGLSFSWTRWAFTTPLNEGHHSVKTTFMELRYRMKEPWGLKQINLWSSVALGYASSSIGYDGFVATARTEASYGGLVYRVQLGGFFLAHPDVAFGAVLGLTETTLEEIADLNFASTSLHLGLQVRWRLPIP